MAQMRTSHRESQLMFMAFDLLHQDGVDLRGLPLVERKLDLHRLYVKARVPFMRRVETFPNGEVLLDHCNQFGFEGRRAQAPSVALFERTKPQLGKCPGWKRINSERWRIFEGPTKPELTEIQKTLARRRAELARVIERLRSPPLSHGIARELRKQVAILKREIPELEQG